LRSRQRDKERLEAKTLQPGGREQQEEAVPPVSRSGPSLEDAGSPKAEKRTIAPIWSQAKAKWLLAMALAVALITGICVIWFAAHKERTANLFTPTPTPSRIRTTEQEAEAAFNRGLDAFKRGTSNNWNFNVDDLNNAISDFTEAIRLNPKFADAYYNRGNIYAREGKSYLATAYFAKADELKKTGR
jgi:tetratricopeptide (TPR) repeat protein